MSRKSFSLPLMIKRFFSEYMPLTRNYSPNTTSAYSETFMLFLRYLRDSQKIAPSKVTIHDLSAENILGFLSYIQTERNNGIKTRNARLAAIHSFVKFLIMENPLLSAEMHGALSVPMKRASRKVLEYLNDQEMMAILESPDDVTWCGKRDRVLFSVMYNTGARVSEIANLNVSDIKLERNGTIHLFGKGRKERSLPLWKKTFKMLQDWIKYNRYAPNVPLFPNNRGGRMTRSAIAKRLSAAVVSAKRKNPQMKLKDVSPHMIRHTTAMHLLQSGVDITVIAMWLGHESIETTHIYVTSDMNMKRQALDALRPLSAKSGTLIEDDSLLTFLENL
jgi:site-specific recombinase XerD